MNRRPLARLAASALLASACPLFAQPIETLGDLWPGTGPIRGVVQVLGTANGKALLVGSDAGTYGLWASNGTSAGTLPIADFSLSRPEAPVAFTASPQRTFITRAGAGYGGQLIRTDGTQVGTFLVRDAGGTPLEPVHRSGGAATADGAFYVYACAGYNRDCGIWYTDGATPTAVRLAELGSFDPTVSLQAIGGSAYWRQGGSVLTSSPDEPGEHLILASAGDSIQGFTAVNGRLYFIAASAAGDEAWSSDGTAAGTVALTAFANATPFSFALFHFHATGGRVYFLADDGVHGEELWSTDGTAAGTRRDTDFSYQQPFGGRELDNTGPEVIGGRLVFAATDGTHGTQLWSKTGNAQPVVLLDSCDAACSPMSPSGRMLAFGGRVYFVARDLDHGYEVWSSDGTKAGTRLLVDGCPGSCSSVPGGSQFRQFVQAGSRLFFWTAYDLWVTDGGAGGTVSVYHDSAYQLGGNVPRPVVAAGGRYLFDGRHPTYGYEILVTDGTASSADVLGDLMSDAGGSLPTGFASTGSRVFFSAFSDPSAAEQPNSLWVTDGTAAGTVEVTNAHPALCGNDSSLCTPFIAASSLAYFLQRDGNHRLQLWRSDGTVAGTVQLTAGPAELSLGTPGVAIGSTFFFARRNAELAIELWSSDGTAAGTQARFVMPEVSAVYRMSAVGSELYFVAADQSGAHAWRTDGTLAGTRKLTPDGYGSTGSFVRAGNAVWFYTQSSLSSGELWRSDGTAAGTHIVAIVSNPIFVVEMVSFQNRVYFIANASPAGPRALWRVNDQQNGVELVKAFPDAGPFEVGGFAESQGVLYFVAKTAAEGVELWRSDGTAGGTVIVRDIAPGPDSSRIGPLNGTPQGLFFAATDGVHGLELWRSDGTAAGTRLVYDLGPGALGSSPGPGVVGNNHLVFAATDQAVGTEPRSLDLLATPSCVASDTALCLNGNRFRVTAIWKDFQGNTGVGQAVALTADTGYFWFFNSENVEVMLKVLDGHGVNGHDWVFYGALSSVEYTLTVTDTQTGAVRRYFNPSGRLASVGDTQGFGPLGGYARTPPSAPVAPASARRIASGDTSPCVASATLLCLNGGRFAVEAAWKDFAGHTGVGHARVLTGDTGYFWFFSESNVEVVIKVLDGTPLNGKFWLFYGALSSVEYTLTVRDTVTGTVRVYRNVSGNMASVADTSAF